MSNPSTYVQCHLLPDVVKVVNIQGKLKSSKRQSSELHFDFTITAIGEKCSDLRFFGDQESVNFARQKLYFFRAYPLNFFAVCLADSVLAFHKHGMQGRSFKNSEVTQEIFDRTRIFKLLGSDRYSFSPKYSKVRFM